MKLLTKEIIKKMPKLYETDGVEDKTVVVKFFDAFGSWSWYVCEGEEQENGDWLFFGLVDGLERELGYFSLSELESLEFRGAKRVERDKYLDTCKLSEI